jgi:2-dehydropantoate 2-reductase
VFNPVSAITGLTVDAMVSDPAVKGLLAGMMGECLAVAAALGVRELPDIAARLTIHPSMAGVKTSMLQDMEAGRPLELGALVDAVCELGGRTGVPTPLLEAASALAAARWRHLWAR